MRDSLDDSDPPEDGSYHQFVSRMEYRADRRETREWRLSNEARLQRIEKKLIVVGLVLAALSVGHDLPWPQIAQVLGW